jgi:hypothetical protein
MRGCQHGTRGETSGQNRDLAEVRENPQSFSTVHSFEQRQEARPFKYAWLSLGREFNNQFALGAWDKDAEPGIK